MPIANRKCLILISVLLVIGTRGIGYGQASVATLSGLTVSPVDIVGFDSNITEYHVGVANSVTQVTITATSTDAGATIQIGTIDYGTSAIDRNTVASGSGQVVSLDEGENRVIVWVTSYGGNTRKDYTIIVGRGVESAYGWKASDDFNTLRAAGNHRANGIWSNGTTMWVADVQDDKLYAYNMQTKARDAAKDFNTLAAAGNGNPKGIWSDGMTMWVADWSAGKLFAYNMANKARDASRDIDSRSTGGSHHPEGIWSDGITMWVAYKIAGEGKLYAHTIDTNSRDAAKDFNTLSAAGNEHPAGIWSDGYFMWVADNSDDKKLYAYRLSTKRRLPALDFDTLKGAYVNIVPTGIWSDGTTMWVADANGKIFSFNMPLSPDATLSGLTISPAGITGFSPDVTSYHLGVANEVSQVTVTPTANNTRATIDINGTSISSGSGHTVSLAEGQNDITITVTAQDGTTTREYTLTIDRGSNAAFGWKVTDDFNDLDLASGVSPRGIWSDGTTTMWVACATGNDNIGANLCGYNMTTKKRGATFHTLGTYGNNSPMGIVSDGTTMYVADVRDDKIYAYKMATYARDPSKEINLLTAAGNTVPAGITISIGGIYVADDSDDKIYAYQRHTKERLSHLDFNTLRPTGNTAPNGIWTDGTTMWVADASDAKLYAYNRRTTARDPAKDFNTLNDAGNTSPWGIWSDGTTMWVVDSAKRRIFSYNMPIPSDATLRGLTVIPANITGFSPDVTAYHVGVANDVTQLWVMPTTNLPGTTIDFGGSNVVSGSAHSVALSEGKNDVPITVTADDGRTTRVYTITVGRSVTTAYGWNAVEDFNTLNAAGNDYPTGLWSDGTTMWVADPGSDAKLYAYNRSTRDRDAAKDFNTLGPVGNTSPRGIWSDGATMWVADPTDDRIYAYNIVTKSHDRSKDFNTLSAAGNEYPTGIWSNGTTMWVLDTQDDKIYAYNLATKARDATKDFNTLSTLSGGNRTLSDLWSDGTTMWVVADREVHVVSDDKVYAYDMATKARDSAKDFNGLTSAGNEEPSGIWSDGTTLWVANYEGRAYNAAGDRIRYYSSKIYAYNMPIPPAQASTDFNSDGKTDFVDFFLFADAYGGTDPRFDLDGNGMVDFADFFEFVDAFGS